ncbi:MAG: response regulator [Pseudaminobacter sp.]|nr:response regulator [Pseudaminobacter sp.]
MSKLLAGLKVLVVEDEMLIMMMTEDMLTDLGCESVTAAATVNAALALIDSQAFDIAMLDMNLNGAATNGLADALAAHEVPFVFATGYTGYDPGQGHGDRPMLRKPFGLEDLSAALTRLLAHRQ